NFGLSLHERDGNDEIDVGVAQEILVFARQLMAKPSGFSEKDGERFPKHAHEGNDLVGGAQFGIESLSGRRRDGTVCTIRRAARDQRAKLSMKRIGNARDHGRSNLVDAGGLANLVGNVVKEFFTVVTIAEEAAIERTEPRLTAHIGQAGECGNSYVEPPSGFENVEQRLAPVYDQVEKQESSNERRNRKQGAARKRVLQAAANDDANVEQAMAQDAVGERERKDE